MIAWLSGAYADLQAHSQALVDEYWHRLKEGQKGRKGRDRATLGLRLRPRENGSFSIEWYRMGHLRREGRDITADYIRKGYGHRYSETFLLRDQPLWVEPLVVEFEELLSACRHKTEMLGKIRASVVHYQRNIHPKEKPLSEAL